MCTNWPLPQANPKFHWMVVAMQRKSRKFRSQEKQEVTEEMLPEARMSDEPPNHLLHPDILDSFDILRIEHAAFFPKELKSSQ